MFLSVQDAPSFGLSSKCVLRQSETLVFGPSTSPFFLSVVSILALTLQTITMRAARGLLAQKLTTPQAISNAPLEEEVEALHSEGNVQRGMLFT